MKNKELKKIAKKYGANVDALKECLIENGYELSDILELDVVEVLLKNVWDLLYTRRIGGDATFVEYADNDKLDRLIDDHL